MNLNELADRLQNKNQRLVTAESCTGGWVSQTITSVPGSSNWFDRGYVTYSNQSKIDMLGVSPETLEQFGAVSEQCAKEMAEGAISKSGADVSVSITGIAGPNGGTKEKPVGTVWFGFARKNHATITSTRIFDGDREAVRKQAVEFALMELFVLLKTLR